MNSPTEQVGVEIMFGCEDTYSWAERTERLKMKSKEEIVEEEKQADYIFSGFHDGFSLNHGGI
jgi:hypothetical protein